jgi:hypothetical protein
MGQALAIYAPQGVTRGQREWSERGTVIIRLAGVNGGYYEKSRDGVLDLTPQARYKEP